MPTAHSGGVSQAAAQRPTPSRSKVRETASAVWCPGAGSRISRLYFLACDLSHESSGGFGVHLIQANADNCYPRCLRSRCSAGLPSRRCELCSYWRNRAKVRAGLQEDWQGRWANLRRTLPRLSGSWSALKYSRRKRVPKGASGFSSRRNRTHCSQWLKPARVRSPEITPRRRTRLPCSVISTERRSNFTGRSLESWRVGPCGICSGRQGRTATNLQACLA
jgi:hypothetical protein